MAKINRFNGNVKAIAADSLTGERSVFGTTATVSDDLTDQYNAAMLRGWGVIGASDFPPLEWFNAMAFTATQFIAYLHQMGIAEWNGMQEYQTNGYVNRLGVLYVCKTADHVSATPPESDPANWQLMVNQGVGTSDSPTFAGVYLGGTAENNNLNDYEYGSFTPAFLCNSGSLTHTQQQGRYVKVGGVCHVWIDLTATNSTDATLIGVDSLPFSVSFSGTDSLYPGPAISNAYSVNLGAGATALGGYWLDSSTSLRLHSWGSNTAQLSPSVLAATSFSIRMEGSYQTA